ncbi:MAG: hypothetical protein B7X82_02665 [Hydrogenophilales bacterium 17-64-65]|jgi:hypothetical protein|nr:MAG: hypothetical protein B7Y27_09960 [Hydrogenophilales bacterium 16-64-40]OZA34899.1 MAG: hypothetical protein B7X82_02665 [Hydrogenophilales bacterium 17-64-65]
MTAVVGLVCYEIAGDVRWQRGLFAESVIYFRRPPENASRTLSVFHEEIERGGEKVQDTAKDGQQRM